MALTELLAAYKKSPEAKRLDAIRGIDVHLGRPIVARIGPVERFKSAGQALIGFAGLPPGVQESDRQRGGTGTLGAAGPIRTCGIIFPIEASVGRGSCPDTNRPMRGCD